MATTLHATNVAERSRLTGRTSIRAGTALTAAGQANLQSQGCTRHARTADDPDADDPDADDPDEIRPGTPDMIELK